MKAGGKLCGITLFCLVHRRWMTLTAGCDELSLFRVGHL